MSSTTPGGTDPNHIGTPITFVGIESDANNPSFTGSLHSNVDEIPRGPDPRDLRIAELEAENVGLYTQRSLLVSALARCFPSGIRDTAIEGWDPEWHGCCYIDLPQGQVSFHYHRRDAKYFLSIPPYGKEWDGHSTKRAHDRLMYTNHGAELKWFDIYIEELQEILRSPPSELHAHEISTLQLWVKNFQDQRNLAIRARRTGHCSEKPRT